MEEKNKNIQLLKMKIRRYCISVTLGAGKYLHVVSHLLSGALTTTGQLGQYTVFYNTDFFFAVLYDLSRCQIWPSFHCLALLNIVPWQGWGKKTVILYITKFGLHYINIVNFGCNPGLNSTSPVLLEKQILYSLWTRTRTGHAAVFTVLSVILDNWLFLNCSNHRSSLYYSGFQASVICLKQPMFS